MNTMPWVNGETSPDMIVEPQTSLNKLQQNMTQLTELNTRLEEFKTNVSVCM